MAEETNVDHNDGTWSGLKKTIIGTLSTVVLGGGTWLGTQLFGGKEETPVQQQTAQPSIIINNSQQQQQAAGGTNTIIKERVVEKPAADQPSPAPKPKKKEGDEFKEKPAQW
jgi:hypothetical protein